MTNSQAQHEHVSLVSSTVELTTNSERAVATANPEGHASAMLLVQIKWHTEEDVAAFTQHLKKSFGGNLCFLPKSATYLHSLLGNVTLLLQIQQGSNCPYMLQSHCFKKVPSASL